MDLAPRNLLSETLLARGRSTPQEVAIASADGPAMTYGELDDLSARLANVLVQRYGVTMGDRVAVQLDKSAAIFALNIACSRMGAVYLPLNPSYTDREVVDVLDDAAPSLLVRQSPLEYPFAVVSLERLLSESRDASGDFNDVAVQSDTPAAMLYTSGTTGRPKGVVLSHENLVVNCRTLNDAWGITSKDVVHHVLPLFHTHGLFVAGYCALSSGASMLMAQRFDARAVVRELSSVTVFMGVPTHYVRMLEEPALDAVATASVRLFISGSAPMLRSTHQAFAERTGHQIVERYGMTETGMLTSNPIDGTARIGTVGRALAGVSVRIDGPSPGVVEVKGPNVFLGYWRRPELRATEFTTDGWFKTGDLGVLDGDGYLEIVGRAKDVIITGGLNVYPKELEVVIDTFPGVLETAVIGLPDSDFGEVVTAVVVAQPGAHLDEATLGDLARRSLAGFKVPKRFILTAELPRNAMGKVEKARLRELFSRDLDEGR